MLLGDNFKTILKKPEGSTLHFKSTAGDVYDVKFMVCRCAHVGGRGVHLQDISVSL